MPEKGTISPPQPQELNHKKEPRARYTDFQGSGNQGYDPAAFKAHFGAPVEQLQLLVEQNSVTIARLMELAPAGTTDPTSGLYNSTMVLMAALLGIALISNALMRPVHSKHHIVD